MSKAKTSQTTKSLRIPIIEEEEEVYSQKPHPLTQQNKNHKREGKNRSILDRCAFISPRLRV